MAWESRALQLRHPHGQELVLDGLFSEGELIGRRRAPAELSLRELRFERGQATGASTKVAC